MGLLEDARAEMRGAGAKHCSVTEAMSANPKLAGEIESVIKDRTIPHTAVARAFQKNGIVIGRSTIERHRNGGCTTCTREGRVW